MSSSSDIFLIQKDVATFDPVRRNTHTHTQLLLQVSTQTASLFLFIVSPFFPLSHLSFSVSLLCSSTPPFHTRKPSSRYGLGNQKFRIYHQDLGSLSPPVRAVSEIVHAPCSRTMAAHRVSKRLQHPSAVGNQEKVALL